MKLQCGGGDVLLHTRVSACLDRVSVLDLALTVHFLNVLEMRPGDWCLCKGTIVYHPGLVFEVLHCLELRPLFKFLSSYIFSLALTHTRPLSIAVSYKKQFNC